MMRGAEPYTWGDRCNGIVAGIVVLFIIIGLCI